jgi:hypothetical protein
MTMLVSQGIILWFDAQISSLVNTQEWQRQNDEARLKDQRNLHNRLSELESNLSDLKEMFSMFAKLSYPCRFYNILLL